tara:strand:- start:136 stop:357 length:222 start_codon:yes stop_codon:yes gene_type:complete
MFVAVADHCLRGLKMKLSNPFIISRIAASEMTVRIELKVLEKRFVLSQSRGDKTAAFGGSSPFEDFVDESKSV